MALKKQATNSNKVGPKKLNNSVNKLRPIPISFEAQTQRQHDLMKKIENKAVIFAVGSPGTGKTLCGMAAAVKALFDNKCEKIIVTRPTISSGPEIGFLPGTQEEKMAPFLVPIMDALNKLLPKMIVDDLIDSGKIEIASISFVRGRNFENAYVIVDEAENLDRKSFYLLLTRVCEGSKLIFCGDSSQIDLRNIADSGLEDAVQKFEGKDDFGVVRFTLDDCRRSPMVKEVIRAYYPHLEESIIPAFSNDQGNLGIPKKIKKNLE